MKFINLLKIEETSTKSEERWSWF